MKNTIKRLFLLLLTLPLCGCYPTGLRQNNDVPQRVEGFDTDNIVVYETDLFTSFSTSSINALGTKSSSVKYIKPSYTKT